MKYIAGIDQGGTKTHVAIADEQGHILGLGKSYGACHSENGLAYAVQAIEEAADEALAACGLNRSDITCIAGGLTGLDWEHETGIVAEAIRGKFPDSHVHVVNDCIIAMRAETVREYSAILCAGTGLNCAVRSRDELFTYGFYIQDELQGGVALGAKTVQAVLDSHMGLLPETILMERVLAFYQLDTIDELLYRKVTEESFRESYARLPILLEDAAADNDEVALQILAEYGLRLADFVTARMRKMGILGQEIDVVLSGSIFKCKVPVLRDATAFGIHKHAVRARIVDAAYEPVIGALLLAMDEIKGEVEEGFHEHLEAAASRFGLKRMGER